MKLRKQIEELMVTDTEKTPFWLRSGLFGASLLYGLGVRMRNVAYEKGVFKALKLPCIVISVGNLTLGGTGKTPLTIYLAHVIQELGYRVAVISRGYGGSSERSGGIVSDGRKINMHAGASGDEPFMMAQKLKDVPVLVGKCRYRTGQDALQRFHPDVVLLDDAFQHRRLARDLDIVLLDSDRALGNGYLFPRGTLREDASSLMRCHAVVYSRSRASGHADPERGKIKLGDQPVFHSSHRPYISKVIPGTALSNKRPIEATSGQSFEGLKGRRVYAFSGIARNDDFQRTVERIGCRLAGASSFSDHHRYDAKDVETILNEACHQKADCLLTTEKDFYRLPPNDAWPMDLVLLGVEMVFSDASFDRFIARRLASIRSDKDLNRDDTA